MFQAIIEDRVLPKREMLIDGYGGFLYYDDKCMPLVVLHWQHSFNHIQRYLQNTDAKYNPSCLEAYLLQQSGQSRNEPENASVPYGAFRHKSYDECVHPCGIG